MPLINCEIILMLTRSKYCFLVTDTAAYQEAKFTKTDAKFYVPVTNLSTQDNVKLLEITEVVLVCYNIFDSNFQQNSRVLYTFVFNKLFGQLLDISYIEVWFSDQNSKPLETEDKIESGFKRMISWNKYQSKIKGQAIKPILRFLMGSSFQRVNKIFVLSFEDKSVPESHQRYLFDCRNKGS